MKKRYDSYKPSGIDWIGDIPSHWEVIKLKHLIRMKSGASLPPEKIDPTDGFYPVFGGNGIRGFTSDFNNEGEYVLIGRQGALCGNINYTYDKFWVTEHAVVCYPLKFLAIFWLGELLRTMNLNRYNVSAAQPGLAIERIKELLAPVPPIHEQVAIAAWLDNKCGEIDAAIAKVDREIELIDELKQSEISRVVTRGLNPDAPLRPSGIDWIGNIPKHWKIEKGKYLLQILPGFPADSNLFVQDDDAFPLIRIRDIDSDTTEINYSGEVPENYIITKGDILVGMDGDFNIAQWKGPNALLNQRVCKISGTNKVLGKYAFYVLPKLLKRINDVTYATTVKHLSTYDILNSKLPVPLYSEQQAIADYLDAKCAEIDGLKAKLTKKRETLTELRQSIISEVVTGKRKII